jgi:hypothetical protein
MSAEISASSSAGNERGEGFPAAKLMIVGSERDLKISRIAEGLRAASLFEILYSMMLLFSILHINYQYIILSQGAKKYNSNSRLESKKASNLIYMK